MTKRRASPVTKRSPRALGQAAPVEPASPSFAAELTAHKRASTGQLLVRAARLVNERGVARAGDVFGLPIRAAHLSLFPHLDLDGTRQTELARRMRVSKQAVHQLVAELEQFGVVERVPDPRDGRATLVCFTDRGARALFDGLAVLGELEVGMREALGESRMAALHDALLALNDWLDTTETSG